MALVVRSRHRPRFSGALEAAFRLRRKILVGKLGWDLPGDDGVREVDAYDLGDALHLISFGPDGAVVGTARMTPATSPNLTCDVLQMHAPLPFPRGHDVVESARLCVDLDAPPALRKAAQADLYSAHYELCVREGWTRTLGFFYADFLTAFIRAGFAVDHLGPPVRFRPDEPLSFPYVMTTDAAHASLMLDWMGAPDLLDPDVDPSLVARHGDRRVA